MSLSLKVQAKLLAIMWYNGEINNSCVHVIGKLQMEQNTVNFSCKLRGTIVYNSLW